MEYFIFLVIGFSFGWTGREWMAKRRVSQLKHEYEEMMSEAMEEVKKDVVNIKVEMHEDQVFVYKKEDGSYLAHGKTINDLEDILTEKFPGKLFNCSKEELRRLESLPSK